MMELGKLAYNKWIEVAKTHDPRYTARWESLPHQLQRAWEQSAMQVVSGISEALELKKYADNLKAQLAVAERAAKQSMENEKRLELKLAEAKNNLFSPTQLIGMRGGHRAIWYHKIPDHVSLTQDDIFARRSRDDEPCRFLTDSNRKDEIIRRMMDNIPMVHEIPTVSYLRPGFRQPPLVSITI